jgi:N-sulfoglucosamine sulfohydrolase
MKFAARFAFVVVALTSVSVSAADRPNVLWLFAEDTSPWMGCYGDPINAGHTPNIDSLAQRGVRFANAFVPAPVCSPCRSAMMGGQNQIRFNAHEHRSSRGPAKISLPPNMKLLPQLMKESGYFTFNFGKDDYNFVWDQQATYSLQKKNRNAIPWETLKTNQPFFGQIQTAGGKNNTKGFPADRKVDPATVTVPPDYPQNQIYREVVAQHYDAIRKDDDYIGTVLAGLKKAGLTDNTIVVYFGDHGANHLVRHKQMPTEGGLHVPFMIAGPEIPSGVVRDRLVNLLDLSATTLAWGGVDQPAWYEGRDLFAADHMPREYVASAKDRLDHTIDRVRTLRTDRFRYTRNYKTDRIFLQPQYRDKQRYLINLRELYASGELSPKLTEIYFGERPAEEFYDIQNDPSQLNNLIDDPKLADEIARHQRLLDDWLSKGDAGAGEESLEELAYQAKGHKWGAAVNPEYEVVRQDSDGDGLSDAWETINNRDPTDGRLLFTFDCGGWQTEGWKAVTNNLGNIAGRQGFLEFQLKDGSGAIKRDGLKLNTAKNQGDLVINLRTSEPVTVNVFVGDKSGAMMSKKTSGGAGPMQLSIPVGKAAVWRGTVTEITIGFLGMSETRIEFDSIAIE